MCYLCWGHNHAILSRSQRLSPVVASVCVYIYICIYIYMVYELGGWGFVFPPTLTLVSSLMMAHKTQDGGQCSAELEALCVCSISVPNCTYQERAVRGGASFVVACCCVRAIQAKKKQQAGHEQQEERRREQRGSSHKCVRVAVGCCVCMCVRSKGCMSVCARECADNVCLLFVV